MLAAAALDATLSVLPIGKKIGWAAAWMSTPFDDDGLVPSNVMRAAVVATLRKQAVAPFGRVRVWMSPVPVEVACA